MHDQLRKIFLPQIQAHVSERARSPPHPNGASDYPSTNLKNLEASRHAHLPGRPILAMMITNCAFVFFFSPCNLGICSTPSPSPRRSRNLLPPPPNPADPAAPATPATPDTYTIPSVPTPFFPSSTPERRR